jgi:hypothetical protein
MSLINKDNFVYDRTEMTIVRDPSTKDILGWFTETSNVSIEIGADSQTKTDATGAAIRTFYNAKTASFSAEQALWNLDLVAISQGADVEEGTEIVPVRVPVVEQVVVGESAPGTKNTTIVLKATPLGTMGAEISQIVAVNGGNKGKKYTVSATASANTFEIDAKTKTITLPTDSSITKDTEFLIIYEANSTTAKRVTVSADKFPKQVELIFVSIFTDPCDENDEYAGYIWVEKAKADPNMSITLDREGTFPFSFTADQKWCDKTKKLFDIIIEED